MKLSSIKISTPFSTFVSYRFNSVHFKLLSVPPKAYTPHIGAHLGTQPHPHRWIRGIRETPGTECITR